MPDIILRKEALKLGLKLYFTGKPCKNQHINARWTYNSVCVGCDKDSSRKWYKTNKSLILFKTKQDRLINPQKYKETSAKSRNKNRHKIREGNKRRKLENPERERFYASKRRAIKLKATPKWADLDKIKEIYLNCPKNLHVDHIVPLQGRNVCGLHVENNLQYLTKEENCRKSNIFFK